MDSRAPEKMDHGLISFPFNIILPSVGFISLKMARPSVVLPQPLSPTRPMVSERITSKVTSSTAFTNETGLPKIFFAAGKYTFKLPDNLVSANSAATSLEESRRLFYVAITRAKPICRYLIL